LTTLTAPLITRLASLIPQQRNRSQVTDQISTCSESDIIREKRTKQTNIYRRNSWTSLKQYK